jgi:hypothetical protein
MSKVIIALCVVVLGALGIFVWFGQAASAPNPAAVVDTTLGASPNHTHCSSHNYSHNHNLDASFYQT